ncbi:polysaccharide deacetylase family protein [Noviherbaspirillum massiliense]|uniref:polysaccharide deacetylase family protein n=1 Tax=Noviherbaspirillum massiliense TaxID=1465823 RepID=UPI00030D3E28|nr:polysaccharide deacetylase family protein [Noviherbaspirillum massiliense]
MTAHKKPAAMTARLLRAAGDRIARRDKPNRRLCIVNYHRILAMPDPLLAAEPDVNAFRWQVELLADCFNVMPLHEALAAQQAGDLPPRAVCITFDDGYRSVYELAVPILKDCGVHATVFVTTGYLGKGSMWNDRIIEAVQRHEAGSVDLRHIGLGNHPLKTMEDRRKLIDSLTARAKYLPPDGRAMMIRELETSLGSRRSPPLMLTPRQVGELARQGIEIGGHTVSHPILTSLEDETACYEIAACKTQLESLTGRPVRLFAYPNGKPGKDFNERHIRMTREAGFVAAFTTALGAATREHDRFQLPRCRPWDRTPSLFGLRLLRWLAGQGQ